MISSIYVIYDKVAEESGSPFLAKNDGIAKRLFQDTVNKSLCKQKNIRLEDYELRCVGAFNSESCLVTGMNASGKCFVSVAVASDAMLYDENIEDDVNNVKA